MPVSTIYDARTVGRASLPTTVIGLLFHAAEHSQRHAGQVVTTARIVRGLEAGDGAGERGRKAELDLAPARCGMMSHAAARSARRNRPRPAPRHVTSIARSRFTPASLGFEVTYRQGALVAFLGAGGFHHHMALHAGSPGEAAAPPYRFAIRYPDRVALGDALRPDRARRVAIDSAVDDGDQRVAVRAGSGRQPGRALLRPAAGRAGARAPAEPASRRAARPRRAARGRLAAAGGASLGAARRCRSATRRRQRLRDLRARLLHLHKVLLDDTKAAYEMDRGRVGSSGNLLQLVINDPWFAWLHSLSELVVRIDETVEQGSPATAGRRRRAARRGRAAADGVGIRRRIRAPLLRSAAAPAGRRPGARRRRGAR